MKTTPITLAPISPVSLAGNLVEAHRADISGIALAPKLVEMLQGNFRVLAVNRHLCRSQWILLLDLDQNTFMVTDGTNIQDAGTLDSPFICATPVCTGFVVMTEGGALYLSINQYGGWTSAPRPDFFQGVQFSYEWVGSIKQSTPPVTLSGVDLPREGGLIQGAKVDALGAELAQAYRELIDYSYSKDCWAQPVLLRYHLYNDRGERVFSSTPTMVDFNGYEACRPVTVSCSKDADGNLQVPSIALSMPQCRLNFEIVRTACARFHNYGITSIQVTCMPILHPLDESAATPCRVTAVTSSTPSLTVAIPGATNRFEDLTDVRAETLRQLVSRFDDHEIPLGTYDLISIYGPRMLPRPEGISCAQESKAVARALSSPLDAAGSGNAADALTELVSPPNSFIAKAVCTDSGTITWGGITPMVYAGADPLLICDSFVDDEPWTGVLQLTRSDSSRSAVQLSGSHRPLRLAACVAIRDPSVTALSFYLSSASGSYLASTALHPSPDNRFAARIDLDQSQRLFAPYSGPLPSPTDPWIRQQSLPGLVIAASAQAPMVPLAHGFCSDAEIVAITPAVRSQSSWDFSRNHLYAFSSAGIHALSVRRASRSISASLIDPRGLDDPSRVCFTPSGVMALAGSQLLRLRGSRADTLLPSVNYDALAWYPPLNSLWMRDPLGNVTMLSLDTLHSSTLMLPYNIQQLATYPPLLLASSPSHLLVPAFVEPSDPPRPVAWSWRSECLPPRPVTSLIVDLSATSFRGSLSIYGSSWPPTHNQATPGQLLGAVEVNGSVNAPIAIAFPAPWRQYVTIELRADVSSDFFLRSITLS